MTLAALGVVYGDIGTSPLYAVRECFHGQYGVTPSESNILGVLSLMLWALILVVSVKYLVFVLRADNRGEGGILALTARIIPAERGRAGSSRRLFWLVAIGLFGACLLYGDGMITPAISVLSAVEGIRIITPVFTPYVIPLTIGILAGIFLIQRKGTAKVGVIFGPIVVVWFLVLAVLGLAQIVRNPAVLGAILPWHGAAFLLNNGLTGLLVLGAVVLVVTGAEALYADMGHFGRTPIRLAWVGLVFPALVLNYLGQGAALLANPELSSHPFYALVPAWALVPMVLLATMATIIASQAVISGAFSLTQQAIQLGYLPRLRITHTSASHFGQIYIGPINWLLMIATIALVLGFQSSSHLAAAYGVAVTATMLITTMLFFMVMRRSWGWSLWRAGSITAAFLVIDVSFFAANIGKLFHGAWFALVVAGVIFLVMETWKSGRERLRELTALLTRDMDQLHGILERQRPQRIDGTAVFMTQAPDRVPAAFMQNLRHNNVLHSRVLFLRIVTEDIPRVPASKKLVVEDLGWGMHAMTAHYGFMESPDVVEIFTLARDKGMDIVVEEASFFLGRERIAVTRASGMSRWRSNLFVFLSRNAMDASSYFGIPGKQAIEVGVQLEL